MLPTLRARLNRELSEFSGLLVIIVVGIIGLSFYFQQEHPYRWVALALLLALFGLEVYTMRNGWWQANASLSHGFLAAKTLIIATLMLLPPYNGIFIILFFVLAVEAPLLFAQRTWIAWLIGLVLLSFLLLIIQRGWQQGMLEGMLYGAAFYFFASFALLTRRAQAAREESERLLAELQTAHRRLQGYAEEVEELTIVAERHRLAREMHDTVGHQLTVAAVQLQAAQKLIGTDARRAEELVATVRGQVDEALAELRRTVATLRAPVEEDLSLASALQRLVTQFQAATALSVHLDLPDPLPGLSPAQRQAIYRAAQESLTNVHRHAQAQQVWVQLRQEGDAVILHVGDDGAGVAPRLDAAGFGLRGLRERAAQLGGDFHLTPRPGGGAQATFHIPL